MNPYENAARLAKVNALMEMAIAYRLPAETLAKATDAQWDMLAKAAGVHSPSTVTRDMVIKSLRNCEPKVTTPQEMPVWML